MKWYKNNFNTVEAKTDLFSLLKSTEMVTWFKNSVIVAYFFVAQTLFNIQNIYLLIYQK